VHSFPASSSNGKGKKHSILTAALTTIWRNRKQKKSKTLGLWMGQ
jgi:hypothetical protein